MACDGLVPVTRRIPTLDLYDELRALQQAGEVPEDLRAADAVRRIGDAEAPNTIAAAVYAGYRAGVELGQTVDLVERLDAGISVSRPEAFTLNPSPFTLNP